MCYVLCVQGNKFPQLFGKRFWNIYNGDFEPIKLIGIQASLLLYLTIHKAYHSFVMHFSLLFRFSSWFVCVCVLFGASKCWRHQFVSFFPILHHVLFHFIRVIDKNLHIIERIEQVTIKVLIGKAIFHIWSSVCRIKFLLLHSSFSKLVSFLWICHHCRRI